MCGIVGYVGRSEATPVLLDGLRKLEYRGYDSAGVAIMTDSKIRILRTEGKLSNLEMALAENTLAGKCGIGHTRWATHGIPSETNAHPHKSGDVVLVHNGIVENYATLKNDIIASGRSFSSETDTEVICHLIDMFYEKNSGDMKASMLHVLSMVEGSYSIVMMNEKEPNRIYVAKKGSPLVIGEKDGEWFIASDIPALLPHTKDVIFLEDGDAAIISEDGAKIFDTSGKSVLREKQTIPWTPIMAEKGGYKHFMLKEIFEQPRVLQDVMGGRLDAESGTIRLDEFNPMFKDGAPIFDKISIVACGTSWHAALIGRQMIEEMSRIPTSVEYGSEFRYRKPLLDERTLVISISQSGETADTLASVKMAKDIGCPTVSICNAIGSSIARASDSVLYLHAGPEIGVASTKAFTAQLVMLYMFSLCLSDSIGKMDKVIVREYVDELLKLPRLVGDTLGCADDVRALAERISDAKDMLYIGRCLGFPVALEGALKLKEISYIHAEGFAAGEMKHGPIALIDHGVPVLAIAFQDMTYGKVISNLEETKARGAFAIAVAVEGDDTISSKVESAIFIPNAGRFISPILATIPLQLLAYYIADHKGLDVDQPRNLAKSVTVE